MTGQAANSLHIAPRPGDVFRAVVVVNVGDQPRGFRIRFPVRRRHEVEEIDRLYAVGIAEAVDVCGNDPCKLDERRGVSDWTRNRDRCSDWGQVNRGVCAAIWRQLQVSNGDSGLPRDKGLTRGAVSGVDFIVRHVEKRLIHRRAFPCSAQEARASAAVARPKPCSDASL
jgi:hypothetical protein